MEQNNFFEVELPSYKKSTCSPTFSRDFRGVKISMPTKVDATQMKEIPLCGAFQISSKTNDKARGKLIENTVIVFVDKKTNKNFSFNLIPDKEPIDQPKPSLPSSMAAVVEEYITKSYFNIDVLQFSKNFPASPAKYLVYATVLDIKSEVIEFQVD